MNPAARICCVTSLLGATGTHVYHMNVLTYYTEYMYVPSLHMIYVLVLTLLSYFQRPSYNSDTLKLTS
jgi:hypothetical protein